MKSCTLSWHRRYCWSLMWRYSIKRLVIVVVVFVIAAFAWMLLIQSIKDRELRMHAEDSQRRAETAHRALVADIESLAGVGALTLTDINEGTVRFALNK